MGRGLLTAEEIDILRHNPNVAAVEHGRYVWYTLDFKKRFIKEYKSGKPPTRIFREAGLDPKILGTKRIEKAAARWKESDAAGSLGLHERDFSKRRGDRR